MDGVEERVRRARWDTGYGVTVAVESVPLAHVVRGLARRHVRTGLRTALVVFGAMAALPRSNWLLLTARLRTALAQALFWAVLGPVAVGLFAPGVRGRVLGALSATGAFAGFTYIVKFLGDVSGFSPSAIGVLLVVFGVACPAGVAVTGAVLDRFPQGGR
ncbi:hypothetical protein [Streptomyces sp. NPDC050538]|uniref:hypothetical protein n=1 Tax=Streptomyces sp. NPDC050538 TaxID=3365627 RepID=UPI003795AF50